MTSDLNLSKIQFFALIVLCCPITNVVLAAAEPDVGQKTDTETYLKIKSLFKIKAKANDYTIENGTKTWNNVVFELNPANSKIYSEIKPSKQLREKTIVIYPIFTAAAYSDGGFYDYYKKNCNESCLKVDISKNYQYKYSSSGNAAQVLKLLGYRFISDIDVDKNPSILDKYDKVILLHNEYVTKKEFAAITNYKNVVYLYPNALYAEVSVDYKTNKMTLVRGHNYPDPKIKNGFSWKYDNSNLEYNTKCTNMGFDKIPNGWMLNCYPETAIHASKVLLKTVRDIGVS